VVTLPRLVLVLVPTMFTGMYGSESRYPAYVHLSLFGIEGGLTSLWCICPLTDALIILATIVSIAAVPKLKQVAMAGQSSMRS
jgi:hypothetical protein